MWETGRQLYTREGKRQSELAPGRRYLFNTYDPNNMGTIRTDASQGITLAKYHLM